MEGTTIKPFTEFTYKTTDGQTITATKNNGVVTLVSDKNGVRQLPIEEFWKEFYATVPKLERTPQTDVVDFQGKIKPENPENKSKNHKGLLLGLGALVVAVGAYILTRGKSKAGLEEAAKATGKAMEEIIPDATKTVEKEVSKAAEEIIPDAVKAAEKEAVKIADEVVPEAAKVAEKTTEVVEEITPEAAKRADAAAKAEAALRELEELSKQGSKSAEEVLENAPKSKGYTIVSNEGKAPASATTPKKSQPTPKQTQTDDILGETSGIDTKRRGTYGQDLDDPLDPLNKDDIMSPHYDSTRRGSMGQNLDDPLNPWNKSDPLSPYYEDPTSSILAMDDFGIGHSYGLDSGFGSGFGF